MSYGAPCERGVGAADTMPSGIWRYQDLFLLSMGSGLPRRKLGAIILSARGGSDVGRRSRCGRSGRLWTANAALM